ncbi:MAG: hypothetical protein ACYTGZ_13605 [Planctomycetota bacterium]
MERRISESSPAIREDLQTGRLLAVWVPLALTFLLVTGSTPLVNAAINRLPGGGHEADLAAFAVFLSVLIVLHSPLFVAREISIKLSRHRGGARRALRFMLIVATVVSALEAAVGFTRLGDVVLSRFATDPAVVRGAHEAFRYVWPVPFVIAVRGVYQAHQIQADDTLYVGLGTLVRLGFTALLGFWIAPHLAISGPVLGAVCIGIGIVIEAIITVIRTRGIGTPEVEFDDTGPSALAFAIPLMIANSLGLFASLFYLKIAGIVPEGAQKSSLAAFQEVKPLHWLLASGAFALQSLTTAKVRRPEDVKPMLKFAMQVGFWLTLVLAAIAYTPLRLWFLVDVMGERPGGDVVAYAVPALMLAAPMPILTAARFSLRGVLISRGRARPITVTNLVSLSILGAAIAFDWRVSENNGALNAYVLWLVTLAIEIALLARATFSPGMVDDGLPPPVRSPREAAGG